MSTDGPVFASVSVSPSGEMVEGSAVSLSCSSDANPAANYTWYKDGEELLPGRWFNFSSISSEDSGSYHCSSDNQYGRKDSSPQNISVQSEFNFVFSLSNSFFLNKCHQCCFITIYYIHQCIQQAQCPNNLKHRPETVPISHQLSPVRGRRRSETTGTFFSED